LAAEAARASVVVVVVLTAVLATVLATVLELAVSAQRTPKSGAWNCYCSRSCSLLWAPPRRWR